MNPMTPQKTCISCGKAVKGRSDKKFCNDHCRNNYNNQLKAAVNNYVRNINNALRKNRRILEELMPAQEKLAKTSRERLTQAGFQFRYLTHSFRNRKGNTYFFCYEYGYMPLDQETVLLVKERGE
jgi:predicted nucleic acid-binding Zn ribbon protein